MIPQASADESRRPRLAIGAIMTPENGRFVDASIVGFLI
jgi:hypothetical protein